jgi:hypothetical protein
MNSQSNNVSAGWPACLFVQIRSGISKFCFTQARTQSFGDLNDYLARDCAVDRFTLNLDASKVQFVDPATLVAEKLAQENPEGESAGTKIRAKVPTGGDKKEKSAKVPRNLLVTYPGLTDKPPTFVMPMGVVGFAKLVHGNCEACPDVKNGDPKFNKSYDNATLELTLGSDVYDAAQVFLPFQNKGKFVFL